MARFKYVLKFAGLILLLIFLSFGSAYCQNPDIEAYVRGQVFEDQGNYDQAIAEFTKARQLTPRVKAPTKTRNSAAGWLPLGFLAVCIIGLCYFQVKYRKFLKKLSPCLTGSLSRFPFSSTFKGEFLGLRFTVGIHSTRYEGVYLQCRLMKNHSLKLRIYEREPGFIFPKSKFGVSEIKTGNADFDYRFLVLSNDPAKALFCINNEASMNTVKELFNRGFYSILVDYKNLYAHQDFDHRKELDPEKIKESLQKLFTLSSGL